jgi:two-component system LytT family sensor kinase
MTFIKKIYNKAVKTIALHVIIWTALFFLNFLFLNNYAVPFDVSFNVGVWSVYVFLFYINFLLLMPYFLFRQKVLLYVIASLLFAIGTFAIKNKIETKHMDKILESGVRWEFKPIPQTSMITLGKTFSPDRKMEPIHDERINRPPNISFFSLYGILMVFTASSSLRLIQKWKDDEKRKAEIEKEKVFTELNFLKQQVNPHFLFNALNNIYSLTINTSETASNAILKLSTILRYMLYETENNQVPLKDELNIVSDFIELQKIRLTENVKVIYDVDGKTENLKIAPLLLIPLVENAFKYGIDSIHESLIEIHIEIFNFQLVLTALNKIAQNGKIKKNENGIGIKNIRRRLDLLYPEKYSLITEKKADVFFVKLKIDLTV